MQRYGDFWNKTSILVDFASGCCDILLDSRQIEGKGLILVISYKFLAISTRPLPSQQHMAGAGQVPAADGKIANQGITF